MKVVHISDLKCDNRLISPVQMLRMTADEIESGERKIGQRALVILLNDETPEGKDCFNATFVLANMKLSVAVAAMSAIKSSMLGMLGYKE